MSLRDRLERVVAEHGLGLDSDDTESLLDDLIAAVLAGRMPTEELWVYQGRHGELELHRDFSTATRSQAEDNGATLHEIVAAGNLQVDAGEEYLHIDDGGRIDLVRVQ